MPHNFTLPKGPLDGLGLRVYTSCIMNQQDSLDETGMPQVRSLQRGVELLFLLLDSDRPLGVTELANQTGLPKPTVSRLLGTLVAGDYVAWEPGSGLYTIGPEVARRFVMARLDAPLHARIRAAMHTLRDRSGETVGLWVPVYPDRVCIEQAESHNGLRRVHEIGRRWPLTSGSSGRAYLAFTDDAEVERTLALRPLQRITPFTIVDRREFYEALARVRAEGYAMAVSQTNLGMGGMSAPILGPDVRPIAMLGISGPEPRWGMEAMRAFAPDLLEATRSLSQVTPAGAGGPDE